jgi:hypothetical protein
MRKLVLTTETDGGVTHANVLRDLDKGVGHLGRVGAARGRGDLLDHGEDLGALEGGLAEALKQSQNRIASCQLRVSLMDQRVMELSWRKRRRRRRMMGRGSMEAKLRWVRWHEVTLRW